MLKSLLASTAVLASFALAHAADLPMTKAEPVEYVKVCSEFGDGFYYIPGSDTCLSINGYVRADYWWFEPESRADDGLQFRGRGRVNFDARTATEWGTLRSFLSLQYTYNGPSSGVNADKAFIQFGGWTAGYATSFYDFYDAEAGNTYYGSYFSSSATTHLLAYTATFGNGLAATLSVEDNYIRRSGIFAFDNVSAVPTFATSFGNYGGQRAPDVVASLRWTQGWGEAQIMAAAHESRSIWPFGTNVPDDEIWGWAVGAGVIVNLSSAFTFALEGNYARGAAAYVGLGDGAFNDVIDAGYDPLAVLASPANGSLERSRAWSITGELGYNFTPSLVGHIVASYANYEAPFDALFFDTLGNAIGVSSTDFDTWAVTANLTYTIVKGLTIAGEVSYEERDYKNVLIAGSPLQIGPDYDTWAAGMRLRRSF